MDSWTLDDTTESIDVARVYQSRTSDAERLVLVDRLWPRRLTTAAADLDSWCRNIAPSTTLRLWYAHRSARYSEFRERYMTELDDPTHTEAVLRLQAITEQEHLILLSAVRDRNVGRGTSPQRCATSARQQLDYPRKVPPRL